MAISFSRPDPSSPNAVANANFSTARRGFDQTEVRDLLRMVAAELARLQERERFLDRELRTSQRSVINPAIALDEEVVTKLLGEEAARILSTAREGSTTIRARAEEAAARLLREAADEAQRVREEAAVEAARRRQDAAADAESELQMAKQQGREMVNEARAYRERVLSELARRRELARQQIEQLVHGRDRLVQAFERARLAAVDVMAEMTPLGEPSEYVNLSPTTGPVPVMIPGSPPPGLAVDAGEPSAEPVVDDHRREPSGDDQADPEVTLVSATVTAVLVDDEVTAVEATVEVLADINGTAAESDAADDTVVLMRDVHEEHADADPDREPAQVVSLFAGELDTEPPLTPDSEIVAPVEDVETVEPVEVVDVVDVEPDDGVDPETAEPAPEPADAEVAAPSKPAESEPEAAADVDAAAVDDLFARLRAARAESVAERVRMRSEQPDGAPASPASAKPTPAAAAGMPPVAVPDDADITRPMMRPEDYSVFAPSPDAPAGDVTIDDSPFGRRDAALTGAIVSSARKLKRVLADEQNNVLHTLKRSDAVLTIDSMLPSSTEHAQLYSGSIDSELRAAALAGAASIDDRDAATHTRAVNRANALRPASEALSAAIVAPLRERLARAVTDAAGDNAELMTLARGIYREWKTQRIDEQLDDVLRIAFGRGALATLPAGTPITWVPDPRFPVCADCADNVLSGAVPAGQPFATGQACAPAHEGCRCMVATVPR